MGRRGWGREREERGEEREERPPTQKPAVGSAAEAQALFQTMGMLSPDPSGAGGEEGKEKEHMGQKRTRHKTLKKECPH